MFGSLALDNQRHCQPHTPDAAHDIPKNQPGASVNWSSEDHCEVSMEIIPETSVVQIDVGLIGDQNNPF